jgi:hypothetical protein
VGSYPKRGNSFFILEISNLGDDSPAAAKKNELFTGAHSCPGSDGSAAVGAGTGLGTKV